MTSTKKWNDLFNRLFLDKDARERREQIEELTSLQQTVNVDNIIEGLLSGAQQLVHPVEVGKDVAYDLEVFDTYKVESPNEKADLFSRIDTTQLKGGRCALRKLLEKPEGNAQQLRARQEVLADLRGKDTDSQTLRARLNELKPLEEDVLWMYSQHDDATTQLLQMVYFRTWLTRPLNYSTASLTGYNAYRIFLSPTIGILSPIVYFVVPFLILRFKFSLEIPFWTYLKFMYHAMFSSDLATGMLFGSGSQWLGKLKFVSVGLSLLFYFQGIFNSLDISQALYKICRMVSVRMNNVLRFASACREILSQFWDNTCSHAFGFLTDTDPDQWSMLNEEAAIPHPTFWFATRNFGRFLKLHKTFEPARFKSVLQKIYLLDALDAVNNLLRVRHFSVATFNTDPYQQLELTNFWHPTFNKEQSVCNTIEPETSHVILTGPNAGGKSTLLKAILTNVWLAQTLGVGAFQSATIRPFSYINTQITIPDTKGKESLFEAEMFRCKETLDRVKHHLTRKAACLVAMDEIFNSTNPVEGISGAYAIAKKLSRFDHICCLITTHFTYLTRLQKDTGGVFKNFRMDVRIRRPRTPLDPVPLVIQYRYTLQPGVSRQYIALELLRKNGFDEDIIREAMRIKHQLLMSSSAKKERVE